MAAICHTPIGGSAVRLTRISTYGVPVTGAGTFAVSSSWTSVAMSDDVDTPDEYRVRSAAGGCKAVRDQPKINFIDVTVVFVRADPDLLHLVTGQPVVADASGNSIGWAAEHDTYATGSFALELWTKLTRPYGCTPLYGYLLLPWIVGGVQGDIVHDRGLVDFTISATAQSGNEWGAGPYNVAADAAGTPRPLLAPIPCRRQRHWQLTPVPAPVPLCGVQP